jgi:hypothetical protein
MFSAHGKKKLLLQIQRAKEKGIEDPLEYLGIKSPDKQQQLDNSHNKGISGANGANTLGGAGGRAGSRSPNAKAHSPDSGAVGSGVGNAKRGTIIGDGTFGFSKGLLEDADGVHHHHHKHRSIADDEESMHSEIATTHHLKRLVDSEGITGKIANVIMDTTSRYRPDRDFPVILKAFSCKTLQYEIFKQKLWSTMGLKFPDGEFNVLCEMFDPKHEGVIDGYMFNIVFKKLNMIREDRHGRQHRERQAVLQKVLEEEQAEKEYALEKRLDNDIDFDFQHDDKVHAQRKLMEAARNFDQNTSTVNLESFSNCTMRPANFRYLSSLTV